MLTYICSTFQILALVAKVLMPGLLKPANAGFACLDEVFTSRDHSFDHPLEC